MLLASFPRSVVRPFFACFVAIAAATALFGQAPSAADGFEPNFDGNVYVLAMQPDGKLVVGGQFATFRTREGFPITRNNLARLNPDGSLDESFNPNANGPVRAFVLQSDGRMVIGGDFTTLQPGTGAATTRNRMARLNADGTIDASYNPNLGGTLLPQVHALLLQPDGRIIAGGTFTTAQPNGVGAVQTRNRLARFNADGALDTAFDPNPSSIVLALAQHVEGKIIVGGGFTSFQEAGRTSPTPRNRIARLNPNGTLDTEFNPNADNGVTSLAVQRDGKIVLGGFFTTVQPPGNDSPANRSHLARLNVNGTLDSEFIPNIDASVTGLALQSDGSILVGGTFTTVWGRGTASASRNSVARFNPDGSLDTAFNPGVNAQVNAFAFPADGKVVIGGYFTRAQPPGAPTALVRNRLARLNTDGSLDASFELPAGGRVLTSVVQSDGRVVIGGSFASVGGGTHNNVARLNSDGAIDASYRPDFNGRVQTMVLQPDGKVIVGGAFTAVGGEPRNRIARLNPTGTIDSEFNPNIDGEVGSMVLQSDGKIIVGGTFTTVQPLGAATSTARGNVLRLNADGSLDTGFNPTANSTVSVVALQPDGKVLLGGSFSSFTPNGATAPTGRQFFARLNADGTLDTAFNPSLNARVSTIVVQSDAKIVLGGTFTSILPHGATAGVTRNYVARLNADGTLDTPYNPNANAPILAMALQSDGKIVIGGLFTSVQPNTDTNWTLRKYAARLNTDGTVDPAFNLDIDEQSGNRVDSLRLLSDGRLLVGGNFTSLQPIGTGARTTRRTFARINANGTLDVAFDPGAGGMTAGQINALAVQADNKVIAVGSFSDLGGARTANIARFNPEGTADGAFSPSLSTDGALNAVVVRPSSAATPGQTGGFAWLNRDGSLRTAFAPSANARLSGQVNAAAVQADGRLLLGGAFANLSNATGGNLARFSATGALDTSFDPNPNGAVTAIALQSDGKIIIVGSFTQVSGILRNRIARLNPDGSLDSSYDPNATARINAVVIQGDGKVVIGGAFTGLTPNGAATAVARNFIARINSDGTVDDFNPGANAAVNALTLQADGKVIAGGAFTSVQPNDGASSFTRQFVARFNTDGTLDQNFDPNANAPINALAAQANGQIVAGGSFTAFLPNGSSSAILRNNVARINSDGAIDPTFNPNVNAAVTSLALQPDGAVLIGGDFTTVQANNATTAVARNRLARLNADGSLDFNFNPDVNGAITGLAARPDGTVLISGAFTGLQTNGSIVVGGSFATIGGVAARNLAALNNDGSVNTSFQPRPDGAVNALLMQPDGKLVAGGAFTNIAGVARNRIARFNADGTLDATFNPDASGAVTSLALHNDGRILVGGSFATLGGLPRAGLARINADGSGDAGFTAQAGPTAVQSIAVQSDGRILFATGAGPTRPTQLQRVNADGSPDPTFVVPALAGTARIALQADGRILVGDSSTGTFLRRLNSNGSVDGTFNPSPNGPVTALALQSDGRLVIGGNFNSVGGQSRVGIARISNTGPAVQTLGVSADRRTVTWVRGGTAGELAAVIFEQSIDRATWTLLGIGSRVAGSSNWQLSGLSLPGTGVFYIRARGIAPSTAGTSSGIYESIREFTFANPLGGGSTSATTIAVASAASSTTSPLVAVWSVNDFSGVATQTSVQSSSSAGTTETTVEIVVANPSTAAANGSSRLVNLSTRSRVTPGNPLVVGFAVSGTTARTILVRGIGPALTAFGVAESLPSTRLQIVDNAGRLVVANEGWDGTSSLTAAFAQTGAFPLAPRSGDSAALVTLAPGTYTLQVSAATVQGSGVALAEVYDADTTSSTSRLMNVSTRGNAATGGDALIGGFVISGNASKRVLLRGAGPSLTQFGVTGALADPVLSLFDSQGRVLGTNDNWVSAASPLLSATASVGAFALNADSKDAAVMATLPPGAYTVQVTGVSGSSGTALIEIYELP